MGSKTLNDIFYKPDIGASGAVEKGKFDDGLDDADILIEANKDAKHTQGTDQGLDTGGGNAVVVADIKDAVTKKHSQNTDTDLDATFEATFAKKADKLSVMAATTSAELAGKITDEMGAGKLRFDTSVTAKTAIATLNVNEAGIILVSCAVTPYTITLPTPIGNTGLKYKIKKTDYNYNLITFATVAGKFDFVNDDGTLKDTYTRVNTPGAEVVFVADGANWQVVSEELGQVPITRVGLNTRQDDVLDSVYSQVIFNEKVFDIGANFDMSDWFTGTATSTSAGKLVDMNANFTGNLVGVRIKDDTGGGYTYITAVDSTTTLSVRDDIFAQNDDYTIANAKFVVPIPGKYRVELYIRWHGVIADKSYYLGIEKNSSMAISLPMQAATTTDFFFAVFYLDTLAMGDEIKGWGNPSAVGVDTIDFQGSGALDMSGMNILLVSKD